MQSVATLAAETVARESYGKLLAMLSSRTRDIALAEDVLSAAFASALDTWPTRGVPDKPAAWLLTVAKNRQLNHYHQTRHRAEAVRHILLQVEELSEAYDPAPDRRLALLFVCAHPAIEPQARAPLMLQTVLGIDAARIASAFLVSPGAMSQRLVRAKARIRETGIRFAEPEPSDLQARLPDVLEAIYAAFGFGWDSLDALDNDGLQVEAIFLARTLLTLLPNEPEVLGLLSLLLHVQARRRARRDTEGNFVPLDRQTIAAWDRDMIIEAEVLLTHAARLQRFGRFQCEAAIQSVHAQRGVTGRVNYEALDTLYTLLVDTHPTIGARVAQASVKRALQDVKGAMFILRGIESDLLDKYQPAQVLLALCLRDLGDTGGSRQAADKALAMTNDIALKSHLLSLLSATEALFQDQP